MELRKDYILNRWVIISERRKSRPKQFDNPISQEEVKVCYFCPGNEHLTPEEKGRVEEHGKWIIRWFDNKFPITEPTGNPNIRTDNTFYTFASPFGYHEVIVETNDHKKQLWDLPSEHLSKLFKVYSQRIEELSKHEHVKYVSVFKNHGKKGGTSIVHTHTQLVTFNKVPSTIIEEIDACMDFGDCPYCRIIEIEKDSHRRCFENEHFVAFTPYASRFNYEIWVFSKKHVDNITELDDIEIDSLADIMDRILKKLREVNTAYNFYLHNAPPGHKLHFHIEVVPRIATWAGFELSTGCIVNSVSPEVAAAFYRGEDMD